MKIKIVIIFEVMPMAIKFKNQIFDMKSFY